MNTLRIAQAALATILALGINSTTYAFMSAEVEESAEVQVDLTEMVNSLQAEIDADETSCEDMLAKLNGVLKDIDAKLDEGVPNEAEYLEARKAVSDMRYDLECLAKKLTMDIGMPVDLGMPAPSMAASVAPLGPSVSGGGCSTCGGGGGGGAVGGHGGGQAAAAVVGFGAIIALPFAFDNNNGPGFIASLSN